MVHKMGEATVLSLLRLNWICHLPLTQLAIAWKFFWDANLCWVNKQSYSTARLTWTLIDRRRTNQLLGLDRDVILTTMGMLTDHCIMCRHAEKIRILFDDLCRRCRSAEEEKTVIQFVRPLLGTGIDCLPLHLLTKLSSIDRENIASFIKLSGCFFSVGQLCCWQAALALTSFFLFFGFGGTWSVLGCII